jgi:phage baseplate assembly protein W
MAIKIKSLEQAANNYKSVEYVYKDLALDVRQSVLISPEFKTPIPGVDIKASINLEAIVNSLINLFNTLPGQRFLFPEYGLDLRQFLFTPITDFNARVLGEKIYQHVEIYEPRVIPKQVNVQPLIDSNQYNIEIVLELPELKLTTQTNFTLDIRKQSLIFLPTSKNI